MKDTKNKQKDNNDIRHRAHGRANLSDGSDVWVTGGGNGDPVPGQVMKSEDTPRSYIISTPSGPVRRSRRHLVSIPEREEDQEAKHHPSQEAEHHPSQETEYHPSQEAEQDIIPAPARDPIMTRSKTGTKIACPVQYRENK